MPITEQVNWLQPIVFSKDGFPDGIMAARLPDVLLPSVRRGIRQQFVTEALLLPTVNSSRTRWMPMFMTMTIRLTVTAIIVVAT